MPFSNTPLNKKVFERIRWEEAIGESGEKECQRYSGLFFSKAKEAEEANDKEAQEAVDLGYQTRLCSQTSSSSSKAAFLGGCCPRRWATAAA